MTTTTLTYTGADQSVVVPAGVTLALVRMWAAGGGSNGAGAGAGDAARGGPGGFVKFKIPVTPGETLTGKVGQGGTKGTGTREPGNGGGRSQLSRGATILGIAGAGGGAGGYGSSNSQSFGGKGGGTTAGAGQDGGTNGGGSSPGLGGTQSAGGTSGTPGSPTAGASLQGGNSDPAVSLKAANWPNGGRASTAAERGGGGGDGYFGGGGGGGAGTWGNGGGGGSSYVDASATDVVHEQGTTTTAPGTSEEGYIAGVAVGGVNGSDGGNGLIFIDWLTSATVSGTVLDSSGAAAVGRTVRVYNRETGALLASTLTSDGTESGDAQWSNVRLLLKGDGANNGTTFTDSSPVAATVTRVDAITSTTQTKFQNAAMYFDGAGDRLSVPGLTLTLPFTIECWLYPLAASLVGLFDTGPNQAGVLRNYSAGQIEKQGGSSLAFDPPANQWTFNQLIFEDVGGNLRLTYARDGVQIRQGNLAASTAFTQGSTFVVGGINNNGDGSLNAYVSEFRVTNAARAIAMPSAALATGSYSPAGTPGTYSVTLGVSSAVELQVVCLDDAAGTLENDLILRTFPV